MNDYSQYQLRLESNCPEAKTCIGFSKAVQTEQGIRPCTAIYQCPFSKEQMYQWDTPPRHEGKN